jgi:hypothetical protein
MHACAPYPAGGAGRHVPVEHPAVPVSAGAQIAAWLWKDEGGTVGVTEEGAHAPPVGDGTGAWTDRTPEIDSI